MPAALFVVNLTRNEFCTRLVPVSIDTCAQAFYYSEYYMNVVDVFFYGQKSFLSALKDIPEDKRRVKGVCGEWSVKDILGHVGSYEEALAEFLCSWHDHSPTPTLDRMNASHQGFNDEEIPKKAQMPYEELLAQLEDAHKVATENLKKIPQEKLREVGTIPWYGKEYSIEDLIVYLYYGHKREHAAQINVFKDNLGRV